MIDIPKLKRDHIGRWVLYTPGHGEVEKGRFKWWNDKFIFVVYNCDAKWDLFLGYTGNATSPENLRFITEVI